MTHVSVPCIYTRISSSALKLVMLLSISFAGQNRWPHISGSFRHALMLATICMFVKVQLQVSCANKAIAQHAFMSATAVQLDGDIPEQRGGRFAPPLSIPQLKEALMKAAYDPRIRGIHLKIGAVSVGWAKLQVSFYCEA